MKAKKITKPTLTSEGDIYLVVQAVNHNAELLEGALNRIKELEKEDAAEKPIRFEEFKPAEGMTREQAINLLDNLIGMVEDNHDSDYDIALQMAIKALMQEPILENALNRIKELEKDKPCKEWQLNELGYSLGEKIDPCEKRNIDAYVAFREKALEYTFSKAIAEVDRQEKWLAEAGYNAYNVSVAFGTIKRALEK